MSKSLEFCRSVATDPKRSTYTDRDWSKSIEMNSKNHFDRILNGVRKFCINGTDIDNNKLQMNIEILFDENANFDYFTSNSCIHDGTLIFIEEMIEDIVKKVCFAATYNKKLREPKSGDTIKYTVGNFVILNEHSKQFTKTDNPWMHERTTVLLPLKMEIKD